MDLMAVAAADGAGATMAWTALLGLAVALGFITVWTMFAVWLERKASADFQSRLGPMYVGRFHGWLQTVADSIKLAFKEDIIPAESDRTMFCIAPAIAFCGAFAALIAIPAAAGWQIVDLDLGVFFIVAISSIGTIGVIMAGWSSNNKWSLLGAMREAAQLVSYEIPVSLALLVPVLVTGSLRLGDIVAFQSAPFGQDPGLLYFTRHGSLLLYSPWTLVAALVYFTASLAECKRAPFDLPEAESELVSGFHTEYSGLRFSFFFLEEYTMMFVVSAIFVLVFLGGWQPLAPLPLCIDLGDGLLAKGVYVAVFLVKCVLVLWVQIWLRWTLPRLRVDQVMTMGYKYLTPIAIVALMLAALYCYHGIRYIPGIV